MFARVSDRGLPRGWRFRMRPWLTEGLLLSLNSFIALETTKYKYHQQAPAWSFRGRQYVAPKKSTHLKTSPGSCEEKDAPNLIRSKYLSDLRCSCRSSIPPILHISLSTRTRLCSASSHSMRNPTNEHQPRTNRREHRIRSP
jgi:hypothetical protein